MADLAKTNHPNFGMVMRLVMCFAGIRDNTRPVATGKLLVPVKRHQKQGTACRPSPRLNVRLRSHSRRPGATQYLCCQQVQIGSQEAAWGFLLQHQPNPLPPRQNAFKVPCSGFGKQQPAARQSKTTSHISFTQSHPKTADSRERLCEENWEFERYVKNH